MTFEIGVVLGLLVLVIILMATEKLPVDLSTILVLVVLCLTGIMPFQAPAVDVVLAGVAVPWWMPLFWVAAIASPVPTMPAKAAAAAAKPAAPAAN